MAPGVAPALERGEVLRVRAEASLDQEVPYRLTVCPRTPEASLDILLSAIRVPVLAIRPSVVVRG